MSKVSHISSTNFVTREAMLSYLKFELLEKNDCHFEDIEIEQILNELDPF